MNCPFCRSADSRVVDSRSTDDGCAIRRPGGATGQPLEVNVRETVSLTLEIGLAILAPLRELDEVAFLRFASVYQGFESLEDFESAIAVLRAEREPTGVEPGRGERT